MSKDTGGPAFPFEFKHDRVNAWQHEGMTLRDYFAAKAMQGLMANPREEVCSMTYAESAVYSYVMADAMLTERNK